MTPEQAEAKAREISDRRPNMTHEASEKLIKDIAAGDRARDATYGRRDR